MTDRVLEAPSVWLMCLTPLLCWLRLHVEDGLWKTILDLDENVAVELARVHDLIASYVSSQTRPKDQGQRGLKAPTETLFELQEK